MRGSKKRAKHRDIKFDVINTDQDWLGYGHREHRLRKTNKAWRSFNSKKSRLAKLKEEEHLTDIKNV